MMISANSFFKVVDESDWLMKKVSGLLSVKAEELLVQALL